MVLVPSLIRPRLESSPIDGVRSFERSMGILAKTRRGHTPPGRWVMVPNGTVALPRNRRNRVIRRRRQNFVRLLAASATALALGLVPALRVFLVAHLVADVALAAYVLQLRRWHLRELERLRKVRALPAPPDVPEEPASQSV